MIIDYMKMCNIGVYKGIHCLDLKPESRDKRITLIGGVNGAGKTTLLNALQIGLFGINHAYFKSKHYYHEKLVQMISRGQSNAYIELEFRIFDRGEEIRYRVIRTFGIKQEESIHVYVDNVVQKFISKNWNEQVEKFFPSRLKNLFIFDGEMLSSYSSKESIQRLNENALKILFGLDSITQIQKDLVYYERKKRQSVVSDDASDMIELLDKSIEKHKSRIREIRRNKASIQSNKIDKLQLELNEIEHEYRTAGGVFFDNREEILDRVREISEDTKNLEKNLIDEAGKVLPLVLITGLLQRTLDQAQKEKQDEHSISREKIFKERDNSTLSYLENLSISLKDLTKLRTHLKADYKNVNLKDVDSPLDIDYRTVENLQKITEVEVGKSQTRAKVLVREMMDQRRKLKLAEDERDSVPEEENISELLAKRNSIQNKLNKYSRKLTELEKEISDSCKIKEALIIERTERLKRKTEIEHQNEDTKRILKHVPVVLESLRRIQTKLTTEGINEVMNEMTDCLKNLSHGTFPIDRVEIDENNFLLNLYTTENKLFDIDMLSAGQRQIVCLAIMWAFKKLSGSLMPIVLDTPFSRLDATHRNNLLDRYLTNVSHQVIILSTDKEIDRPCWEVIRDMIARTYTLKYNKETQSTSVVPGYFSCEESDNGRA